MNNRFIELLKRIAPQLFSVFSFSRYNSGFSDLRDYFLRINGKLLEKSGFNEEISFDDYSKYFTDLNRWGLIKEIEIKAKEDNVIIKGMLINSPIDNDNNSKTVIFCHGVTNDRWSLFHPIYLVLQAGYSVLSYDARNHGFSSSSYTTLGKVESLDLEDVVQWVNDSTDCSEIILYGFSMGAATILFWIGKFQDFHPEVSLAICDSPFDNFRERFKGFVKREKISEEILFSEKIPFEDSSKNSWVEYFVHSFLRKLLKSPFDLLEVNPIASLPTKLRTKLLLLHGDCDTVISPLASLRIWEKLTENNSNLKKVNLYFFSHANHGELSFFGDFIPMTIYKPKSKKKISLTFSQLIFDSLKKSRR